LKDARWRYRHYDNLVVAIPTHKMCVLRDALEQVEQRANHISARCVEIERSINDHFDGEIQKLEMQRQNWLQELKDAHQKCDNVLNKQRQLLQQYLEDFDENKPKETYYTVPMVEEDQSWHQDWRLKFNILPNSVSLNFEKSYIDPVSLSAQLHFDVWDINGNSLPDPQDDKFSVLVEEPKNALAIVQEGEVSGICVSVIAVGKATSSELKLKVKYKDTELVDLSKKRPFIGSDHVEGRTLHQGKISNSVRRYCAYGLELFCTAGDEVKVFDLLGNLKRRWGYEGTGPGRFQNAWGITVVDDKVFVSDRNQHCVQAFDLEGNFLNMISIQNPLLVVPMDDVIWVCTPHPERKLTIISKECKILAENLDTFRCLAESGNWKSGGAPIPYGDYWIVQNEDALCSVYDAFGYRVFRSTTRMNGSFWTSVLPDGKMVVVNTCERWNSSILTILDTGLDDKRSIKFYLFKYLQEQSQMRQIEVKSFCKLILSMCTTEQPTEMK
jgi:hypothetical protein